MKTLPDFWNRCNQKFLIAFLQFAFIFIGKALVDSSIFYMNIVDKGILVGVIIHDGEDIYVCNCVAHDLAFGLKFIQELILFLVFFSYFKLQKFCVFHHHII